MNAIIRTPVILVTAVAFSGCASIVHRGPRTIPVASTPPGATVSIYDRSNTLVSKQTTPFAAILPIKFKYFRGQKYRLVFEMPGYQPVESNLESSLSGWYYGNIVFGGLVGLFIVDPLTGAMYDLEPKRIEQSLTAMPADTVQASDALQ